MSNKIYFIVEWNSATTELADRDDVIQTAPSTVRRSLDQTKGLISVRGNTIPSPFLPYVIWQGSANEARDFIITNADDWQISIT